MISIHTKTIFNTCASRLAAAISVNECVNVFQHILSKDKTPWSDSLSKNITLYQNANNDKMNEHVDKTRAANWLSTSITNEDYNITSEKLKSFTPLNLNDSKDIKVLHDAIESIKGVFNGNNSNLDISAIQNAATLLVESINDHNTALNEEKSKTTISSLSIDSLKKMLATPNHPDIYLVYKDDLPISGIYFNEYNANAVLNYIRQTWKDANVSLDDKGSIVVSPFGMRYKSIYSPGSFVYWNMEDIKWPSSISTVALTVKLQDGRSMSLKPL